MKRLLVATGKPTEAKYRAAQRGEGLLPPRSNWFPWLKREMGARGIKTDIPSLPQPFYPEFERLKQCVAYTPISPEHGTLGFSMGAELLLRLFSEDPSLTPERFVMVAPWTDRKNKYGDFSKFVIDPDFGKRVGRLTIITSRDDSPDITLNAAAICEQIPEANWIELDGYGHFMLGNNMTNREFPELIAELTTAIEADPRALQADARQ